MELDLLLEKIRSTAEFRSVREQKAEVEQALQKLKTKRQSLGDCSVRANIKLRGNELKLLAENLDSTETKYQACYKSVDDLIEYKKTPEERRQTLIGYKVTELVNYLAQLEGFKQLQAEVKAEFDKLDGQIKDYDSLLKEQPLDKVCSFIERNAALYLKISDARKKISTLDSAIDVLKINIGEVDLNQAITEFLEQKQSLLQEFTDLNTKG